MRERLLSCATAAVVLVVECGIGWALHRGALGVPAAALLHLLLVVGLGALAMRRDRSGADSRMPALLAIGTLVLGPFAGAGGLLGEVLAARYARRATPFREWYESLFPARRDRFSDQIHERARSVLDDETTVELTPFVDLLTFGTPAEKREVIAAVTKEFRPAFAPVLRRALSDSSAAVRVQAATGISVIESRFLRLALELGDAVRRAPDDPRPRLALARHYDDYAYTGLLDESRETDNRQKALAVYREYIDARPDDATARIAVGRLLLRQGWYDDAAQWLEASFPDGFPNLQAVTWYLECLYRLGRFDELRELSSRHLESIADSGTVPPAARQAITLWAGDSAARPAAAAQ